VQAPFAGVQLPPSNTELPQRAQVAGACQLHMPAILCQQAGCCSCCVHGIRASRARSVSCRLTVLSIRSAHHLRDPGSLI
jgi:hypothetical protein